MEVINFNNLVVKFFEYTIPQYIQIPFYIRTGLICFFIVLCSCLFLIKIFPVLIKLILNALVLLLALISNLVTKPLHFIYKITRKNEANANWLITLGDKLFIPGELIKELNFKVSINSIRHSIIAKYFIKSIYLLPIIAIGVVYLLPNSVYVQKWYVKENQFVKYTFAITGNTAATEVHYLELKDNVRAANIRLKPGEENSIITTVRNGETLLNMHETGKDKYGNKWYKVKANSEKIGWIHGNLIK